MTSNETLRYNVQLAWGGPVRKWANSVSTLSEHCATRMTTGERDPQSQTLLPDPQDMVTTINYKKKDN